MLRGNGWATILGHTDRMPDTPITALQPFAALASIVTALVAAYAYGNYRLFLYRRMRALEAILQKKNKPNDDSLTLQQLAVELTLTESQIIEAASRSKKIESWAGQLGKDYRLRMKRDRI